jgi:hypothetical protein
MLPNGEEDVKTNADWPPMPHNLQRLDEGWPEPNAQNVEKFNCLTAKSW